MKRGLRQSSAFKFTVYGGKLMNYNSKTTGFENTESWAGTDSNAYKQDVGHC